MELSVQEREVLKKIDFVNKYRNLYKKHSNRNYFENYEVSKVTELIKSFGYNKVRYFKGENFFKVDETAKKDLYEISLNISLKYGVCEFIWDGAPWGMYLKCLGADDPTIKLPSFQSYDELREILTAAFEMYEDYKRELISQYEDSETDISAK